MSDKPYKGEIAHWRRRLLNPVLDNVAIYGPNVGYSITGIFKNHPEFGNVPGYTSIVVSHDLETGEIETLNSRYTLLGGEIGPEKT